MLLRSQIIFIILSSLQFFRTLGSDHCCSLTREQLERLSLNSTSLTCPSNDIIEELPLWCALCPQGLCRVRNKCICPRKFLNDTVEQLSCKHSFLVSWPDSVGKEDIFRRICRSDLQSVSTNNTSCCSLTEQQLNEQRSTHVACPRDRPFPIKDKCHSCPPGTCRLGSECYCPFEFTRHHAQQCEETFGESWPLSSVDKVDSDLQQCEGPISQNPLPTLTPNFTHSESCCSIPAAVLDATLGSYSKNCPSHAYTTTLDTVCGTCPPDTCRVGKTCVCLQTFRQGRLLHEHCNASFGDSWPESVDMEDVDREDCNLDIPSCCSLREDVLNDQVGLNDDCPSASAFPLADKCNSTCSPGTCRVKDQCFCVEHFREKQTDQCLEDFGTTWPFSIGMKDTGLSDCESTTEIVSSPTPPVSPSENSTVPPAPTATDEVVGGASESRLSGVEIAGTAAGVISTLIALVVSAGGFFKWRQKQRTRALEEHRPFDDLE